MRRACFFALVLGSASIASVIGCAAPEGEPYVPAVRRNPPSPSKPKDEVLKAETPASDPEPPKTPKTEKEDEQKPESEQEEAEDDGKKLGSPCDDDDECKSGKCVELGDDLSICGPP